MCVPEKSRLHSFDVPDCCVLFFSRTQGHGGLAITAIIVLPQRHHGDTIKVPWSYPDPCWVHGVGRGGCMMGPRWGHSAEPPCGL